LPYVVGPVRYWGVPARAGFYRALLMPDVTVRSPAHASARSAVRSLARLWPWVRPIRGRLVAATVLAAVASVLALLMPLVLKSLADGPVTHRDPAGVWLGGGLLLVVGAAEAVIFGVRRWLVARPLAGSDGQIVEDGTPDQLLATPGRFARLHRAWHTSNG
jgi:ABC-type multidrug transport system fused ATPase/permease subunit